jgi:opacity protein-like surface antigen
MGNVFGFEQEFAYARDFFGKAPGFESSVLTVMSNLVLVPNTGPIRPYALIGAGLIKSRIDFTPESIIDGDNNHFGWDAGGGFMGFFGDHVGLRAELRFFRTFQDLELLGFEIDGEKLKFGRASAGLIFKF